MSNGMNENFPPREDIFASEYPKDFDEKAQ